MPGDGDAALELLLVLRVDFRAVLQRVLDAILRRLGGGDIGRGAEAVAAQEHALALGEEIPLGIADRVVGLVGIADAAIDMVVLLPEAALHLQAHLQRRHVGQLVDGVLHRLADIHRDLAEHRGGDGADAPVGRSGLGRAAGLAVYVGNGDALVALLDLDDLAIVLDQRFQRLAEGLADLAHAALGLEDRGLHVIGEARADRGPQAGLQQLAHLDALAGDRHAVQPAAGIAGIAAMFAGFQAGGVFVVLVQRAPVLHRRQQDFLVLLGDGLVQCALLGGLGQKFGDLAVEVRLDVAIALRLAAERVGGMDIGVVVDLGEGLQRHAQPVDVMQDALVVIGQAPGAGIDVLAGIELDMLGGAAQFGIGVAAIERPVTAAGAAVIFQHRHFIAGVAQLHRRDHAGNAGAQHQHRCAGRRGRQLDRALEGGSVSQGQFVHGVIQGRRPGSDADHGQKGAPAGRQLVLVCHV